MSVQFVISKGPKKEDANRKWKKTQMNLGILKGKQRLSNISHNYGYRRFQSF